MPTYVNTKGETPKLAKAYAPPSEDWIPLEEWQKQKEESANPTEETTKSTGDK